MKGFQFIRNFTTSTTDLGKRNLRKFHLGKFRGTKQFRKDQRLGKFPDIPVYDYGERQVGYKVGNKVVPVAEMIPEIIVPNLEGCELKPYVSYRAPEVVTNEFKAEDLFNAVYYEKIVKDFKEGKLSENGESLESNEKLTAVQAEIRARQTGSDIFRVEPKIELEMPKLRIGMDKSRK
ncbi:large ribosomal subunit protein mL41-like [Artemia franciscana]|uniref:large ribosomal subunit protein mL41-like n=1 Tax=Artemia franciscana TaxID=6661 RepID=UPI0032DABB26